MYIFLFLEIRSIMENEIHLELLKEKIVQKYGRKITCHAECDDLAETISTETKQRLSSSTVKRIFGLLKCNTNFSKHTFNILSIYVGYKDWDNFIKLNNLSSNHFWNSLEYLTKLKSKALLIEMDIHANIIDANEVAENILQKKKEELNGKNYFDLFSFPEKKQRQLFNYLQNNKTFTAINSIKINNTTIHLAESFHPVTNASHAFEKIFYLAFQIKSPEQITLAKKDENTPTRSMEKNKWMKLNKVSKNISRKHITLLKETNTLDFNLMLKRKPILKFLNSFYQSKKIFTSLIAPKGYGKTIGLIHWLEHYFLGNKSKYKNDIVLFLDYQIISKQSAGIWEAVQSEIKYYTGLDLIKTIFNRSNPINNKIVIVIDNIDINDDDKTEQLIDDLSSFTALNNRIACFKIIFSCRVYTWLHISKSINNIRMIKNLWYGVDFEMNRKKTINIPLLEPTEVRKIFKKLSIPIDWSFIQIKYKTILSLFEYPFFIEFFIQNTINHQHDIEIFFYKETIQQRILLDKCDEEKMMIIKSFVERSDFGTIRAFRKSEQQDVLFNTPKAYPGLIENGILIEYKQADNLTLNYSYIQFLFDFLFKYLVCCNWLDKNGVSKSKIVELIISYAPKDIVQDILQWIVKSAVLDRNIKNIKNLISILWLQSMKAKSIKQKQLFQKYCIFVVSFISNQLILNSSFRNYLLPVYHKSKLVEQHFLEYYFHIDLLGWVSVATLNGYAGLHNTSQADVFLKVVLFLKFFFGSNNKQEYYPVFEELVSKKRIEHKRADIIIDCIKILVLVNQNKDTNSDTIAEICAFFQNIQSDDEFFIENAYIAFLILETLTISGHYKEICKLRFPTFLKDNIAVLFGPNLINIYRANAYLKINDLRRAMVLYKSLKKDKNTWDKSYFSDMRYNMLNHDLWKKTKKNEKKAYKALLKARYYSKLIKLNYYANLLKKLTKQNNSGNLERNPEYV